MRQRLSEMNDAPVALGFDGGDGQKGPLPTSTASIMPATTGADAITGDDHEGEQPLQDGGGQRDRRRRRHHHASVSWLIVVLVAGGLALGLRLFVVQTFYVPSASMVPTLQVGDRMLVLKVGYTIDRGSILVFRQPPRDTSDTLHEDLVKRVIGLPGDTIWSVGNTVYIDGRPLSEPWLPKDTVLGPPIPRQTIPPGDYFMMGDNRTDSLDSRSWGVLQRRLVVGEVLVVIWRGGSPVFHIQ